MGQDAIVEALNCEIERRGDSALVVRVRSQNHLSGRPVPDAVFSFRAGDPQYDQWEARLHEQERVSR